MAPPSPAPGEIFGAGAAFVAGSPGERQRLASLLLAVAQALLLVFVLAVALPLLPPRLADPFWQLAFTTALCSQTPLALLAVLLVNLAAALLPEAEGLVGRRRGLGGLCRWVALAFLMLIPLQGIATWRALDWAGAAQVQGARQDLQRMARVRQAVTSAGSMAALEANLAAIQAPPLGPADRSQSLPALKATILGQVERIERQVQAAAARAGAAPAQRLPAANLSALLKDGLRVVLLSLAFAVAFAAAGQRKGSELSLQAEWLQAFRSTRQAAGETIEDWLENREEERHRRRERAQRQRRLPPRAPVAASTAAPPAGQARGRRPTDAAYFEELAADQDDPSA